MSATRRKFPALFPCFASPEAAAENKADGQRHRRRNRLRGRSTLDKIFRPLHVLSSSGKRKRKEAFPSVAPDLEPSSGRSAFSSESSLSSSSYSSSSTAYSLGSVAFAGAIESPRRPPPAPPPRAAAGKYGARATGVLVLLVSLSAVVFCGRICAILLISSSMCLVQSRRGVKPARQDGVAAAAERWKAAAGKAEREEKSRVVMQGLLDRNRRV